MKNFLSNNPWFHLRYPGIPFLLEPWLILIFSCFSSVSNHCPFSFFHFVYSSFSLSCFSSLTFKPCRHDVSLCYFASLFCPFILLILSTFLHLNLFVLFITWSSVITFCWQTFNNSCLMLCPYIFLTYVYFFLVLLAYLSIMSHDVLSWLSTAKWIIIFYSLIRLVLFVFFIFFCLLCLLPSCRNFQPLICSDFFLNSFDMFRLCLAPAFGLEIPYISASKH